MGISEAYNIAISLSFVSPVEVLPYSLISGCMVPITTIKSRKVHSEHPFIKNYLEDWGASEPLRLIGAADLLTEI